MADLNDYCEIIQRHCLQSIRAHYHASSARSRALLPESGTPLPLRRTVVWGSRYLASRPKQLCSSRIFSRSPMCRGFSEWRGVVESRCRWSIWRWGTAQVEQTAGASAAWSHLTWFEASLPYTRTSMNKQNSLSSETIFNLITGRAHRNCQLVMRSVSIALNTEYYIYMRVVSVWHLCLQV